jgi:hypothetical protein
LLSPKSDCFKKQICQTLWWSKKATHLLMLVHDVIFSSMLKSFHVIKEGIQVSKIFPTLNPPTPTQGEFGSWGLFQQAILQRLPWPPDPSLVDCTSDCMQNLYRSTYFLPSISKNSLPLLSFIIFCILYNLDQLQELCTTTFLKTLASIFLLTSWELVVNGRDILPLLPCLAPPFSPPPSLLPPSWCSPFQFKCTKVSLS